VINETNSTLSYNTAITSTFNAIQNVTGGNQTDTFSINAALRNITGNANTLSTGENDDSFDFSNISRFNPRALTA